ncbi:hypothetical protein KIPB_007658, partial [Kipferlia bialata]
SGWISDDRRLPRHTEHIQAATAYVDECIEEARLLEQGIPEREQCQHILHEISVMALLRRLRQLSLAGVQQFPSPIDPKTVETDGESEDRKVTEYTGNVSLIFALYHLNEPLVCIRWDDIIDTTERVCCSDWVAGILSRVRNMPQEGEAVAEVNEIVPRHYQDSRRVGFTPFSYREYMAVWTDLQSDVAALGLSDPTLEGVFEPRRLSEIRETFRGTLSRYGVKSPWRLVGKSYPWECRTRRGLYEVQSGLMPLLTHPVPVGIDCETPREWKDELRSLYGTAHEARLGLREVTSDHHMWEQVGPVAPLCVHCQVHRLV